MYKSSVNYAMNAYFEYFHNLFIYNNVFKIYQYPENFVYNSAYSFTIFYVSKRINNKRIPIDKTRVSKKSERRECLSSGRCLCETI